MGQRIEATQEFIVRAKKRIQGAGEEVTRAQEAADAVLAKLHNEEESLKQGRHSNSREQVRPFGTLMKILFLRRISARYGLRGVRVGEAAHPGPPRIRVLLDPASHWSEVPTTANAATSREVDSVPISPSHCLASAGEVARVLGQDVPSTVVGSARVASRDDVVSENNRVEGGTRVKRHRRLVLV